MSKYTCELLAPLVVDSMSVAEVCRRLGVTDRGSMNTFIRRRITELELDTTHFLGQGRNRGDRHVGGPERLSWQDVLVRNRRGGSRKERIEVLRRALLECGRPHICAGCGLGPAWCDEPLVLEVDHVDGDPLNNEPDNVRFLCPNCHSQTGNHGVLNIRSGGGTGRRAPLKPECP